jgi:hypothetical protein
LDLKCRPGETWKYPTRIRQQIPMPQAAPSMMKISYFHSSITFGETAVFAASGSVQDCSNIH